MPILSSLHTTSHNIAPCCISLLNYADPELPTYNLTQNHCPPYPTPQLCWSWTSDIKFHAESLLAVSHSLIALILSPWRTTSLIITAHCTSCWSWVPNVLLHAESQLTVSHSLTVPIPSSWLTCSIVSCNITPCCISLLNHANPELPTYNLMQYHTVSHSLTMPIPSSLHTTLHRITAHHTSLLNCADPESLIYKFTQNHCPLYLTL